MSCHTCFRAPASRTRFFCPTCARNQLYQLRVETARVLLEKQSIAERIQAGVILETTQAEWSGEIKETSIAYQNGLSTKRSLQIIAKGEAESRERMRLLGDQLDNLTAEIKDKRLEISQRKLALARRHSDSESAQYQLGEREAAILANIQNNTKRTDHLWHSLHSKTAEARIFLCREAANLYGLQRKTRNKEGLSQEVYTMGGIDIIDLRDMNGTTPAYISTSLFNVAHLLVLISHYLSLRLPAEITLPHKDHPIPTICAPSASYLSRDPNSVAYSLRNPPSVPSGPRTASPRPSRPRPLSIDRALPKLAREDPGTYALFLEGVTLLAWNVSWLCRTQGINITSESWEEVCNVGKNMWQLLVAPPAQPSTLSRAFAGRDIQAKMRASKDSPRTTIQRTMSFPMLGHYSHGTAHSFLGAVEGAEFMRTWRLPTPTKIVDKLKSTLLGEMASAEWELLEGDWDDASQEPSDSMLLQHPSTTSASPERQGNNSGDSVNGAVAGAGNLSGPRGPTRMKGTSGWTKLRNR
ncbi:UV radiation resistance protein and autophagy-related subunit 14-domain-containing protein [Aspergillus welwitschiae]|uniref:Autophagy-related protein 14 n=1 Tax=Aspergillus welwitschiae TaxID=1341132 RepID=A0A3F3PME2_9EURO|nr:UV radiation resistance protein and autophagy-related subunit 14-domain-containing protein [Aspergillus welwitschiae]RDH28115.1 UV radiation resistance protein and autophagy-related subunit 14-domain-containing protein [Aspergillus welwitschiae]